MAIWIIAAVLLALAILPLGIHILYDADGFLLKVIAGPLKIRVYPLKKKKSAKPSPSEKKQPKKASKKQKPTAPDEGQKTSAPAQTAPAKASGGSLTRFLPFVKLGIRFLGDLRRKLRLDQIYLRLMLAGEDPCDLAVNYGRTWAAAGCLMSQLEQIFVIKSRDVEIQCDFTAEKTTVIAHLDITITLGRLLVLAVCYGVRVLIEFIAMKKKAVPSNE